MTSLSFNDLNVDEEELNRYKNFFILDNNTNNQDQQQQQDQQQDQQQQKVEEEKYTNNYEYQKTIPFSAFCELLEKVSNDSKANLKKKHLLLFFDHYKDIDNFHPLLRLLLPQLDKERQTYGLKEKTLAKFYVEILNINSNSIDGCRLLNWRKPTTNEVGGDFGTAVSLSLKNRCIQKGKLSLADINIALDGLNSNHDRNEKLKILKKILRFTTSTEQKWFVRIILKELKTGMSEKTIFKFYHPEAMNLFNITSSIRRVAIDLKFNGGSDVVTTVSTGTSIKLFQPIKPMLANRQPINSVLEVLNGDPFVVETKFDGERIQIHKDGDQLKLYSRNSNDCTYIYGNLLAPIVKECVQADRVILDGELLVWDTITERFEEFGKLKTLAIGSLNSSTNANSNATGDTLGENFGKQICYMVFDILFIKDQSVMELSLEQRTFILKRCIKSKYRSFEIAEQKQCTSTTDIINLMDTAILNRDEGIMIKNLNSSYVPGERKEKWIKLKPEYLDGVGDDLDLVIIGGYYGSGVGRRGGTLSHFMLGVPYFGPDGEDRCDDPVFYSFCKVGSGYSYQELRELQKSLDPHWKPFKTQNPPKCIQLAEPFKEKPDVWIDPKHSRVLQIKAAQLVDTEKYRAGYTCRFPRVVKIRDDKDWKDCLDYHQLITLAQEFEGRYAKRKYEINQEQQGKTTGKKRKNSDPSKSSRKKISLMSIFQDTDTSNILPSCNIFQGLEFCVIKGDLEYTKSKLEIMIVENGGTKVQYPSKQTNYVVSSKEVVKIQNLIQSGFVDIVHLEWIVDCVMEKRLIPLGPKYMIFTTEKTKQIFIQDIDRFGDSYTLETNQDLLKDAFSQIVKQNATGATNMYLKSKEKLQLEEKYFNGVWWALFRKFIFYLDRYQVVGETTTKIENNLFEMVTQSIKFYGGSIVQNIDNNVTHIVIDERDKSRLHFLKDRLIKHHNCIIVSIDWIYKFIQNKQVPINMELD
eukprot:gene2500-3093_t